MVKIFFSRLTRAGKITAISILSFLVLLLLLPELFPGFVSGKIKTWANQNLTCKLNYSKARLSLIKHFPNLTLSLYDFSLTGSAPFEKDTLVAGNELAFGISLTGLLKKTVDVDQLLISHALVNIQVDSQGHPNYNIYKVATDTSTVVSADSSTVTLSVRKIAIRNSKLIYNDRSLPMFIHADGLNYTGKGDLAKSLFDLKSKLEIERFDFAYGGSQYFINKKIVADLLTTINTNSLSLIFERNDLQINRLPVSFKGQFDFLANGYQMDFQLHSQPTSIENVVSVLPPGYLAWQAKTQLKGEAVVNTSLSGQYIASTKTYPDLYFNLEWKDGYINYQQAPEPLTNVQCRVTTKMPGLNTDSLLIDLDTLAFKLDKDYVKAGIHTRGINPMTIAANADISVDLAKVKRAAGIDSIDMRGKTILKLVANGRYASEVKPGWSRAQITELPAFTLKSTIQDGYIKTNRVPFGFERINLNLDAACDKQRNLNGVVLNIQPLSFLLAGEPFMVQASLDHFEDLHYNIRSKGTLDLNKLYTFFRQEGIGVKGKIKTDISLKGTQSDIEAGRYQQLDNNGTLAMENISLSFADYPQPFLVKEGVLEFKQDKVWLRHFNTAYAGNELMVEGFAENIIPYIKQEGALKGNAMLSSAQLNLDAFQSDAAGEASVSADTASLTTGGVIIIPANLSFAVNADVKNMLFDSLHIQDFKGALRLDKGTAVLQNTGFKLAGTIVQMDAQYQNTSADNALFDFSIKADSFDVQRAYKEVKLFRDFAASAEKAKGIISLNYHIKGRLQQNMEPVYPSLNGGGELTLEQVQVNGLKLFSAVSKATGKDSIQNPDLSKVVIKSTVANNIITIERTRMKVFGFRPRIEGQTSFDGRLNLKFSLGLPPFGVIGIPMTVTGTTDHPVVKLRRGTDGDILQETEDDPDEMPEEKIPDIPAQ